MNDVSLWYMAGALAFNVLIIKYKFEHNRFSDALLDGMVLFVLGMIFMGTIEGLKIATIASMIVSVYLLIFPPKEYFAFLFKKRKKK